MPDRRKSSRTPSRRRRDRAGAESTVSVADLLARHAREDLPTPRRVTAHQAPPERDETDQFSLADPPGAEEPEASEPEDGATASGEPEDGEPESGDPEDGGTEGSEPGDGGPEACETESGEHEGGGPADAPVGSAEGARRRPSRLPDLDEAPTEVVPRTEAAPRADPAEDDLDEAPEADAADPDDEDDLDDEGGAPAADDRVPASRTRAAHPDERAGDADPDDGLALRARKIDESLVRLTAIHAGLGAEVSDRVSRSSRLPQVHHSPATDTADPPDDDGPAGAAGPAVPPRLPFRIGKAALAVLAVLLFATAGLGWGAKSWLDGTLRPVAALDPNSDTIVDRAAQQGDENYLLVGSDVRPAAGAGARTTGRGARSGAPATTSDTVMLAHLPATRDRAVVVSFPRDVRVERPSCDRWDPATATYPGGTAPAQAGVTLSTVYEVGGPRCLTKVVQKLTGLAVNHFTAIDLAGFRDVVDAVGGVPICLERPVVDGVLGRVVPTAGRTVLAGEQALGYVRAGDVRGDPSPDYGRIQRQQRFLSALLTQGLSEDVLLSPSRLRDFVSAFAAHTRSEDTGLDALGTLGGAVRNLDPEKVTFVTVPTVADPGGGSDQVLRDADAAALFAAIRTDQPLPGQAPAAGDGSAAKAAADTLPPGEVTLSVRNGSSRTGLANQVASNLRSVGFRVGRVGDAEPTEGGRTLIRHSADRTAQAATVAAAVPSAVTQVASGPSGVLELVLGDGFDGNVTAAGLAASGESPLLTGIPLTLNAVNAVGPTCR